ncbi:hypothetical protein [Veronia pacifica]|uniref:Uncharacterized protein n=1 Tax=Veronia pacifica TaxID=1080227 RepID=A0A1C3EF18_9GAMM|nr:hypothetical protein [Veronia pacifica]ODA31819.1 hypothetical protein A8L45_15105 [Veronia pacifica]
MTIQAVPSMRMTRPGPIPTQLEFKTDKKEGGGYKKNENPISDNPLKNRNNNQNPYVGSAQLSDHLRSYENKIHTLIERGELPPEKAQKLIHRLEGVEKKLEERLHEIRRDIEEKGNENFSPKDHAKAQFLLNKARNKLNVLYKVCDIRDNEGAIKHLAYDNGLPTINIDQAKPGKPQTYSADYETFKEGFHDKWKDKSTKEVIKKRDELLKQRDRIAIRLEKAQKGLIDAGGQLHMDKADANREQHMWINKIRNIEFNRDRVRDKLHVMQGILVSRP